MKFVTFLIFVLCIETVCSQSIYKSSYSAIGNVVSEDRTIIQSVGQIQPTGIIKDEYTAKQGFLEVGNFVLTSIEEYELGDVYPNPVRDILITGSYKNITLMTISGAVIYQYSYGANLSTLNLSEGLYIVEIERESGRIENHKIIKN